MICRECRFWSDLDAEVTDLNGVRARCLHPKSHRGGFLMLAHHGCMWGEPGEPIDLPDMNAPPPRGDANRPTQTTLEKR